MAAFLYESSVDSVRCDAYNDDPTRVRRVAAKMASQESLTGLAAICAALGNPIRAAIYAAIRIEPLCVCELGALLGHSSPALMHHLRHLDRAGLISVRKEGKFAIYEPLCGTAESIFKAFDKENCQTIGAKA